MKITPKLLHFSGQLALLEHVQKLIFMNWKKIPIAENTEFKMAKPASKQAKQLLTLDTEALYPKFRTSLCQS